MKIGLVYAMTGEIESLLTQENAQPLQTVAGVPFYQIRPDVIACAGGVSKVNAAMATLKENGTFDALVDKYISKNEDAVLPELKTVENPKGTLVMGTNCEFEPFEYLDENGEPTGFDVDYVKYLCAEMGYEVTIENMDFDALIPALQSGRIDFIAAGLTRDEEREKNANFTDGYYEAVQSIVVAIPEA